MRVEVQLGATEAKNAPLVERIMLPALNLRGIRGGGGRRDGVEHDSHGSDRVDRLPPGAATDAASTSGNWSKRTRARRATS